ncbi:hypothetical protein [Aurantivibrio plasticivorans]
MVTPSHTLAKTEHHALQPKVARNQQMTLSGCAILANIVHKIHAFAFQQKSILVRQGRTTP